VAKADVAMKAAITRERATTAMDLRIWSSLRRADRMDRRVVGFLPPTLGIPAWDKKGSIGCRDSRGRDMTSRIYIELNVGNDDA
jgi:hypothetical protein